MNKALSLLQTDSIGSTQLNETTIMKESAKTENQIELLNECKRELKLEKILMLLEKNCSVNQLDETDGYACIRHAWIRMWIQKQLNYWLNLRADPFLLDHSSRTALHCICINKSINSHYQILEELKNGAKRTLTSKIKMGWFDLNMHSISFETIEHW